MKLRRYLITIFCLTAFSISGFSREFTDVNGRKLDAELLSVSGDQATLKRSTDGQTFTLATNTFSAEDQIFINDFAAANTKYKFEVRFARTKLDEEKARQGNTAIEKETWAYKVDIRNLSPGPVADLRADYTCFSRKDDGKGKGSAEKVASGSHEITSLARGATEKFETSPVVINKKTLDAGWYYTNGNKSKQTDAMGGLVIRIFKGDREVFTFASSEGLISTEAVEQVDKTRP